MSKLITRRGAIRFLVFFLLAVWASLPRVKINFGRWEIPKQTNIENLHFLPVIYRINYLYPICDRPTNFRVVGVRRILLPFCSQNLRPLHTSEIFGRMAFDLTLWWLGIIPIHCQGIAE